MKTEIHFHFITLFPETIQVWLSSSILGRAKEKGIFDFTVYQLRDFAADKHKRVDDTAFGGGGGMVLKIEPLVAAIKHIQQSISPAKPHVIYFSPAGQKMDQRLVEKKSQELNRVNVVLVCGHYEGVDQRFIDHWVDEEISLGDFVLTGGELPALAFADSLLRQYEGTLGNESGHKTESFSLGHDSPLVEYPHYTRPAEYLGLRVPEVLLQGNHSSIEKWRNDMSEERTRKFRPDLLNQN